MPRGSAQAEPVGEAMIDRKDRERVTAEITLSHLMRLGREQGYMVSRQQALAFLNQDGRAFEMWKRMMQAAEDFIARGLFQDSLTAAAPNRFEVGNGTKRIVSTAPR